MAKPKKTSQISLPAGIGAGVGVSVILSLGMAAILAMLIGKESLAPQSMGYGVLVILMVSSLLGAFVACIMVKGKRMLVSLATAAGYLLALLCITALFFGGQYHGVGVTALVVIGGGMVSALAGAGKPSSGKKKRVKRFYG